MIGYIFRKIIGSKNDREVKRLRQALVPRINELEQQYQTLTEDQLRAQTDEFKARIEAGRKERGYHELVEKARELDSSQRGDEARIEQRKAFELEQALLEDIPPRLLPW